MRLAARSVWWPRLARLLTGAGGTLLSALTGVIRNKWFAQHLDTAGIGVLSQVVSGQTWIGSAAGLGLSLPVARAVSADTAAGRRAAWSAALLAAVAGGVAATIGLLAAPAISQVLLGTPSYAPMIRISMIGVVGLAVWTPAQGFFSGRSDLRPSLTFALVGGGGATLAGFFLVPRFGLQGAIGAVSLLFPLGLAGMLVGHAPAHAEAILPRPRPLGAIALREALPLLTIAGAGLLLALADLGTMLALRAHYLRANGVAANGLVQAALALSQQVGAVFYAYLSGYAFGRANAVAAASGLDGVRAYTRRHWPPLLLLALGATVLTSVAAAPILHVLYSARFDAARPLMALTLWGELGRVATQAVAIGALAVGGTRLWFAIGITQPLALAATYAWFARGGAGMATLPLAYVAAAWITFVVALLLLARHGVTLHRRALAVGALAFAAQAIVVRFVVG
jgi:O-antigen/teichoic acid export membrane protein